MGIAGDPLLMWGQASRPQEPAQRPAEATREPADGTEPAQAPPGMRVREAARRARERAQTAEPEE